MVWPQIVARLFLGAGPVGGGGADPQGAPARLAVPNTHGYFGRRKTLWPRSAGIGSASWGQWCPAPESSVPAGGPPESGVAWCRWQLDVWSGRPGARPLARDMKVEWL